MEGVKKGTPWMAWESKKSSTHELPRNNSSGGKKSARRAKFGRYVGRKSVVEGGGGERSGG